MKKYKIAVAGTGYVGLSIATMHIPRKPGEQIEVDWAGDPAHIIDPDTGEITNTIYAYLKSLDSERGIGDQVLM